MGTGDYICITMTGGAPWGFRLQGGRNEKQPLKIAKVGQLKGVLIIFYGREMKNICRCIVEGGGGE